MIEKEWWVEVTTHANNLRYLVEKFHPVSGDTPRMNINAAAAEDICEGMRQKIVKEGKIVPVLEFDRLLSAKNGKGMIKLLNETWFGMPESRSVRSEPGFFQLCDLAEGWNEEEPPPCEPLTEEEKAEIDRLYEEHKRHREEDGGVWPEYTGPGK